MFKLFFLFIFIVFFNACSFKDNVVKVDKYKKIKFFIPVKLKVEEKETYWYKKEGTKFLGIIDSNNSVAGIMYYSNDHVTGKIIAEFNNKKLDFSSYNVINCEDNTSKINGVKYGNYVNPYILIKPGYFCYMKKNKED